MRRVKCKSGMIGWQDRLHKVYTDFEQFLYYCGVYGIHTRLGYKTPEGAWRKNPTVQGSVIPTDLRKVRK